MNGLGDHDHRRPAAEAVRLLHRRRRLRRRGAGVRRRTSTRRNATTLVVGLARRSPSCSCCRGSRRRVPAVLVAVVGATVVSAALRPRRPGRDDGRLAARRACPRPPFPWTQLERRRRRCSSPRSGITLVSLTDTIATVDELRRPARRRGRARPGDDRHRRREHRRRALPGLRRLDQRLAHRGRRAVGRQEPAHRARRRRRSSLLLLLFLNSLLADLPQTALAAVVIAAALSLMDLGVLRRYCAGAPSAAGALAGGDRRRRSSSACSQGIVDRGRAGDPAVLPAQLVAARRGARPGRRARRAGTASTAYPDAEQLPGVVVYRWEAPLFFANAGIVPPADPPAGRASASPRWVVLQCEAITDIDVTAAEMLEQLDDELNARASTWRSSRCASGCRTLMRYGLFETLDRDHCVCEDEARDPGADRASVPTGRTDPTVPRACDTWSRRTSRRTEPQDPSGGPSPRC